MKECINRVSVVILLICIIVSVVSCTYESPTNGQLSNSNSKVFNKEEWEKAPEQRIKMVDSLTKEHNIIGLSKKEIIDLLGKKEMLMNNKDIIEYFISPGVVDAVGFIIFFDENGKVYKYKISQH